MSFWLVDKPHLCPRLGFYLTVFPVELRSRASYTGVLLGEPQSPRPGRRFMPEGYCVKCKAKKEIADAMEEVMKNGRRAIKGRCPTCGTVMFKILGGKGSTTPAEPKDTPVPPA
jgi:Domain of unknown function (DUF5679)